MWGPVTAVRRERMLWEILPSTLSREFLVRLAGDGCNPGNELLDAEDKPYHTLEHPLHRAPVTCAFPVEQPVRT